jgi:CBS domain-containing protein
MQASDIMTQPVISVAPDTAVADIAKVLLDNRISAVPVVDRTGRLVGIVSEGDLLRRVEAGTERRPSRWLEMLRTDADLASEYVSSRARTAVEIMTRRVVTATAETPVRDIVDLMEEEGIKRVLVVDNGVVIGMVSRANLLQALRAGMPLAAPRGGDDRKIREALLAELQSQPWADRAVMNVIVADGVVHLWGIVRSGEERRALRVAAESVVGVAAVEDHLVTLAASRGT